MVAPQISRTLDPDLAGTCVVFRFGTGDILVLSELPRVNVELLPMQGGGSGRHPCRRGKTWRRTWAPGWKPMEKAPNILRHGTVACLFQD